MGTEARVDLTEKMAQELPVTLVQVVTLALVLVISVPAVTDRALPMRLASRVAYGHCRRWRLRRNVRTAFVLLYCTYLCTLNSYSRDSSP